jgi:lathosterol oxidase
LSSRSAPEFRFGEGRISGVLSATLGALSVLAVLCFRFPDVLTTPDLRAAYPIGLLRGVLFAALLLGLGLGLVSVVLSRGKRLGHLGIALSGLAVVLGGAWVETGPLADRTHTLGLDWFVLNLLVLAIVFVPLERAFALRAQQRVLRDGFRTDLTWFFASHLLVQMTLFLTMAPAALFFGWAVSPGLQAGVSGLPLWLQVPLAVLVADLFQYGIHRLFHAVPWLWRFHAIHHSSRELDWLAGSRLHLVDVVVTRAIAFLPLFVLGFSERAMLVYVSIVSFQAVWIHANVRTRFAWLGRWIVTPEFHHWHHTAEPEARDRNFAVHLPGIDALFGTAWRADRWPTRYGVEEPVPDGWLAQLLHPFRRTPGG